MKKHRREKLARHTLLLIVLLSAAINASAGTITGVTVTSGFDVSRGDFEQPAETEIRSVPLTIKIDTLEWVVRMQSSYLQILQTPLRGSATDEGGIGDTILSVAKKSWFPFKGINYVNAGVRVKIPTASQEKRLGSGETDWMLQFDGFRQVGKWLPFGSLGYRWYGDSSVTPREDGVYGSLGLHYQRSQRYAVGALVDYRSAVSNRIKDGKELVPYITFNLDRHWSINLYGVSGLSPASANEGGGIQITYRN